MNLVFDLRRAGVLSRLMRDVFVRLMFICVAVFASALAGQAQPGTPSATPSPAATPPSSDIFIVDLKTAELKFGQPKKVTTHPGYNNQPFFTTTGQAVFYTSIRNRQADIYRYDIGSGATSQITNTPESEYSPTLMPDGKSISVVRVEGDGTQRLWKFPLGGDAPSLILENIKPVGYHWWIDKHTLALFILGASGKPHTLQIADVRSGKADLVIENPGRIFRRVPHQNKLSFVHKVSDQEWIIKTLDLKTRAIATVTKTLAGVEDYAWTPAGVLLMAKDSKLFKMNPGVDRDWLEVADFSAAGLKSITRVAASSKGDRIAMVAR